MAIMSCNSMIYLFHRLKSTDVLVPWRWLVVLLNYLSMLSFVKTLKVILAVLMKWLIFIDLQSICNPIGNYVHWMIVAATTTHLVKSLKQRFTSDGRLQLQGNISYYWGFCLVDLWTTFPLSFHVFGSLFCNCK